MKPKTHKSETPGGGCAPAPGSASRLNSVKMSKLDGGKLREIPKANVTVMHAESGLRAHVTGPKFGWIACMDVVTFQMHGGIVTIEGYASPREGDTRRERERWRIGPVMSNASIS